MLFVVLLHRHDSAHGVSDVFATSVRHYPCMRIICNDILPSLATDGRSACRSRRFTIFCHSI